MLEHEYKSVEETIDNVLRIAVTTTSGGASNILPILLAFKRFADKKKAFDCLLIFSEWSIAFSGISDNKTELSEIQPQSKQLWRLKHEIKNGNETNSFYRVKLKKFQHKSKNGAA